MKGAFIEQGTGKVLARRVEYSHRVNLHNQIFIEEVLPPESSILDVSVYPDEIAWLDDPAVIAEKEKAQQEVADYETKLQGVEYEGKNLSVTAWDQVGMVAIAVAYQNLVIEGIIDSLIAAGIDLAPMQAAIDSFEPTGWKLQNGEVVTVSKDNVKEIASVWEAGRRVHFPVES